MPSQLSFKSSSYVVVNIDTKLDLLYDDCVSRLTSGGSRAEVDHVPTITVF